MDLKMEQGVIHQLELDEILKGIYDLWPLIIVIDFFVFQRAKSKWLKEEDVNMSFFHVCVNTGHSRNYI